MNKAFYQNSVSGFGREQVKKKVNRGRQSSTAAIEAGRRSPINRLGWAGEKPTKIPANPSPSYRIQPEKKFGLEVKTR